jgi:rhamnogalacturonyl hydrolase YesR
MNIRSEFASALLLFCIATVFAQDPALQPDSIRRIMKKAADYQLSTNSGANDWVGGALYTGIMALYDNTREQKYLDAARSWAAKYAWAPNAGATTTFADDQCCFQAYCEQYLLKPSPDSAFKIVKAQQDMDYMAAHHPNGRTLWWWCDALFMAPPGMVRLSRCTGNQLYTRLMDTLWWDTYAFLYDTTDHLFFRDAANKWPGAKTANGKKVFWSRGNGWVIAGTARILQYLPADFPTRAKYVTLFKEMAAALKAVQGADGLWRTSLFDYAQYPTPETSGSAFFCFAIAWGINNGLLDKATYEPAVRKAWVGLVGKVTPQGKLGYVQQIGGTPGTVSPDGSQLYAVGAFLLAGHEMYVLAGSTGVGGNPGARTLRQSRPASLPLMELSKSGDRVRISAKTRLFDGSGRALHGAGIMTRGK